MDAIAEVNKQESPLEKAVTRANKSRKAMAESMPDKTVDTTEVKVEALANHPEARTDAAPSQIADKQPTDKKDEIVPLAEVIKEEKPDTTTKTDETRKYVKPSDDDTNYVNSLFNDDPLDDKKVVEVTDTEKPIKKGDEQKQEKEVKTADPLDDNQLVAALKTFIKNGGNDLNEFVNEIGAIGDVTKLPLETLYAAEARKAGVSEDSIEDAVLEAMNELDGLGTIARAKEERRLRDEYAKENKEKLSTYINSKSESSVEEQKRFDLVREQASATLSQEIEALRGKKKDALLIDDKMADAIYEAAPSYAPPIIKDGKIVGFDVKEGIEIATWKMYGKLIKRSLVDIGKAIGYDEFMNDRHRPNANITSQSPIRREQVNGAKEEGRKLAATRHPDRYGRTS